MSGEVNKYEPVRGEVVVVYKLPGCDFCGEVAEYDFATSLGPWANGCAKHYMEYRVAIGLGVGKAQRLITEDQVSV